MNYNIDLTKILKDCPKGWKFYSSVYGVVEFLEVLFARIDHFDELGNVFASYLSPENITYPIRFAFQGDECRVSSAGEHIKGFGECTFFPSRDQRDWSKFKAPWYKNGNNEKFDPKTLKSFDKVIVKNINGEWTCAIFSHITDCGDGYQYGCCYIICKYCIPYNDDTKHLVGTNDEAPEYYRYWED